jgi:hypothetical protein
VNLRGFITQKLEEQTEFVRWWKETVTPGKGWGEGKSQNAERRFKKDDAESLTGITQQQVSRWRKALARHHRWT